MNVDRLNSLSLCSGGGGLDLGLSLAIPELRTVCWVEWEAFACEVLASRMEAKQVAAAPVWSDLRTFDGKPWRGIVDLVSAGYPCQPFSLAGKRRGSDDPRHLWPHVRRVVGEVEPAICFFENVSGHLSLGFDQVAADLEGMGYEVAAGLFTAEEVGASHRRERLFVLAVAASARLPRLRETYERTTGSISPTPAGGDVAHTQRPIRGPGDSRHCDVEGVHDHLQIGREKDSSWTGISHAAMAHADQPGLPITGDTGRICSSLSGTIPAAERRSELFPPGPDDLDHWRIIPHSFAPAQSKVRLLADGLADDRARWLKLFGNGVVPLQAAYAFCSLWSALRLGRTDYAPSVN